METTTRWTCPACRSEVLTPFCAQCGEEPVAPKDLTLGALAGKLVHAFTSVDARVMRTLWCLVRQPGRLTLSWIEGVRKPYVAPFQLFLIVNVIFFAVQWLSGTNIFGTSLDSHLHQQDWSDLAQQLVADHLAATHQTLAQYAPAFDRTVALAAKSLIVLMTIPFALVLPIVFWRARRPFMAHVAFSLHVYTVLMLLLSVTMLAAEASVLLGGGGLDIPVVDKTVALLNFLAWGAYLFLAIEPVYGSRGVIRVVQAIVLAAFVAVFVLGYRFALLLLTLLATR